MSMLGTDLYYTENNIYGVKMYTYINKECKIIYNKYVNHIIMSNELIKDSKHFYYNLDENTKNQVKIQIHRKCKSIKGKDNCMIWWDISPNKFIMTDFHV
jgi:hypothetical protein